jgi:hypothetical protein
VTNIVWNFFFLKIVIKHFLDDILNVKKKFLLQEKFFFDNVKHVSALPNVICQNIALNK